LKKISNVLILLAGLVLLAIAASWDLATQQSPAIWSDWGIKVVNSLGLGLIIAVVSGTVREWVTSAVTDAGPRISLITADERCERLTRCVLENPNARLFTTRYSARGIGSTEKSKQYLKALDSRIHGRTADTLRIITLDHIDKLKTAHAALSEHYSNPRFGLKVLNPKNLRLIDLMVSEGHFACIGIETRNPDENYWIRIDDPKIANEFRNFYEKDHWGRPEAVAIKASGEILDEAGLEVARARLDNEATKAGLIEVVDADKSIRPASPFQKGKK
jgi:hypothetical protein